MSSIRHDRERIGRDGDLGGKHFAALWLGILMALSAPARAEETRVVGEPVGALSLEAAVELAQEQARAVVRARADIQIIDQNRARALAQFLPTFEVLLISSQLFLGRPITEVREPTGCSAEDVDFGVCDGDDFSVGPFLDRRQLNDSTESRFDLRLIGRQLLFEASQLRRIGRAEENKRRFEALFRVVLNNVRLDVARRFYGYLTAQKSEETFARRVALGEAQLEQAKRLLDAGRGKASDVAIAERNLAADRVTLARRAFATSQAARAFNLSLARPADSPVGLDVPRAILGARGPLVQLRLPTEAQVKDAARKHRPDLEASRHQLEVLRRDVSVENGRYWPRVDLQALYRRTSRLPERTFGDPTDNYRAQIDVVFRWNLLEFLRAIPEVQRARLGVVRAEADYADLERRVISAALAGRENLALQIQVYDLSRDALERARDAVVLARKLFDQGKQTALELRDAELRFTEAELEVINARVLVERVREELRRAVGVDLLER